MFDGISLNHIMEYFNVNFSLLFISIRVSSSPVYHLHFHFWPNAGITSLDFHFLIII